jgi:hypothetical protein
MQTNVTLGLWLSTGTTMAEDGSTIVTRTAAGGGGAGSGTLTDAIGLWAIEWPSS